MTHQRIGSWCVTIVVALALSITGCSAEPDDRGVYMLLDTSGTYTAELTKAQKILNYLLGTLNPGDSLAVARIDSGSFSEKDIVARVTFDDRPSAANEQKRRFKQQVDAFTKGVSRSAYTDITGGLIQSVEWLTEADTGHKTVLIFSDLEEDLQKGHVRDFPLQMQGVEVIALNVTKLRKDNVDPRKYRERLEYWRERVEQGGGTFRVINDLERLGTLLEG